MSLQFSEVKKRSVSETIVEQVQQLILAGKLQPGQKLPSERELAEQMKVGRSSVREGTSALLALGVVEIRPGEGVFMRKDFPRSTLESVEWSSLLLNGRSTDLIEARVAVEVATARLAAQRASVADQQRLMQLADQMAHVAELDVFIDLDLEFHLALALASQNIVLRDMVLGLQQLMRGSMQQVLQSDQLRQKSVAHHLLLCEAVAQRDVQQAEQTMRAHLQKDADFFASA